MKIAKKLMLIAVVFPLILGSANALAFGGKDGDRGGKHGGKCELDMKKVIRKLDLTAEQETQLKEMRESFREEMKGQFSEEDFQAKIAERQAHQANMQSLVLADTFDQAKANELATAMVEKQAERRVKMLEKQHQMFSVLTPEQKAQVVEMQKERATKCTEKMQKRMERNSDN